MQNLIAPDGTRVMMYNSNDPTVAVPPTLINSYSILTIPAYFRAMRFLSENLAAFPRRIMKGKAPLPDDQTHPLRTLLSRKPNAYQNATTFWRTLFLSACHANNGFARIERKGARPVALHNIIDGDVLPFRFDADDGAGMQQYYYQRSTKKIYLYSEMIHFVAISLDGMTGVDPVHLHADTYQRAKTIDKYTTRFLMKGTVLKGAVEVPTSMTDEQFAEFRLRLRSNFRGAEAEDDVLILTDGAKLNNATMTGQNAQLIEQASYSTKQIAQITGVHPHYLFDDKDGKYNTNAEQAGIDVVKYSFRTWMELIDDELTNKLFLPNEIEAGFCIRLDADALKRGDTSATTNAAVAQKNAGLITPNEGREMLERPPSDSPGSDALSTLGDTGKGPGSAPPPKALPDPNHSRTGGNKLSVASCQLPGENQFSQVLKPLIDAAIARIEQKTTKAFSNNNKTGQEKTIWANVFAESQQRYVVEAFAPINQAAAALQSPAIDAEQLGQRYAAAIRKRAATNETVSLVELAKNCIGVPE